ncbi:MAG: hypothetical protein M5U11_01005 [Anaerolineales bacterium]|jgi:hypothetical protein|nr:hypothetical protein [Anaerolineales bacterium]MCZ7547720.1 hypothetical protein [Anaerolineales bacterium]MDX9938168.1 hypothetical protein [Anaerolineales bacterium]GER79040.1 hypothetical protein DIM_11210 [Candidatus Denitrolinea symbiosum]
MEIQREMYEQKRPLFEFCGWVHNELIQLNQEPDFNELYLERRGAIVKKLIEEAVPIAHLGLFFWREWNDVFIQCFADNREYDAIIEIQNSNSVPYETIKIEVTTTDNNLNVMRRQALSRNGYAHFTGTVKRNGRKISTKGKFVETEEESERVIQSILQAFERKLKNSYDERTAILIYETGFRPLNHDHRFRLIEETKQLIREKTPKLYGVFFCYSNNRGVDGIICNQQRLSP